MRNLREKTLLPASAGAEKRGERLWKNIRTFIKLPKEIDEGSSKKKR